MRFTASYDEVFDFEDIAESNNLQSLLMILKSKNVNDYHCIITEWSDEVDCYGANEVIGSQRMCEIDRLQKEILL